LCAGSQPAIAVARTMAIDPEELDILTNHGSMKLRSAVARTMILPLKERKRATIVREGTSAIRVLIQLIVGLDRNSDGFLDAVAYPSRCSEIELDSFLRRSSPETPRGATSSKIFVLASTNNCAEVQP
jgi:hypothetical protein